MNLRSIAPVLTAAALLGGCASTLHQDGLEQRTAQAIGRSVGQFSIAERSEETGGRINYSVNTRDGAAYRCYMYGVTGFQKAMSFGQIPHSDAICTPLVGGPARAGNQAPPPAGLGGRIGGVECNVLLRAAGLC